MQQLEEENKGCFDRIIYPFSLLRPVLNGANINTPRALRYYFGVIIFKRRNGKRRRKKGGKEEEGTPEELRHCREKEYRDELKYKTRKRIIQLRVNRRKQ